MHLFERFPPVTGSSDKAQPQSDPRTARRTLYYTKTQQATVILSLRLDICLQLFLGPV